MQSSDWHKKEGGENFLIHSRVFIIFASYTQKQAFEWQLLFIMIVMERARAAALRHRHR